MRRPKKKVLGVGLPLRAPTPKPTLSQAITPGLAGRCFPVPLLRGMHPSATPGSSTSRHAQRPPFCEPGLPPPSPVISSSLSQSHSCFHSGISRAGLWIHPEGRVNSLLVGSKTQSRMGRSTLWTLIPSEGGHWVILYPSCRLLGQGQGDDGS